MTSPAFLIRASLVAAVCFGAVPAQAGSPYPPSAVISGVTWDFAHAIRLAPGSDLWPLSWGSDDNLYGAFGDGGGFGGTNDMGRASLGFARISGMPPGFIAVNVWGGKDAEHPPTFSGKSGSILSVDGVLYAVCGVWPGGDKNLKKGNSPHESRLIWSRDLGATWELADWRFAENDDAEFCPHSFVNFGRDYEGARDGFVYLYFSRAWWAWKNGESPADTYLARVPKAQMRERKAYEFFTGSAAEPKWSGEVAERKPVFSDPSHRALSKVVFDAPVGRYLATGSGDGAGQFALFDGPEPWGPWATIDYEENWNHLGMIESLSYEIPSKWISADGCGIWMVFSSVGEWDSFNLIGGRLEKRAK